MSTYNFTNPAFGSSMPFAPVDGHYNSVNVGHAFTGNDGMYHNNVDFATPGYHQNAYPVSMNNDASVEHGNLMECTPTGNFTEAPYQVSIHFFIYLQLPFHPTTLV